MNNRHPRYLTDIFSQPNDISKLLDQLDTRVLEQIRKDLKKGSFDRIILSGMGSSLNVLYPTYLGLAMTGLPVIWMDTSELLHYGLDQISETSLIWLVSQSGQSAEILALLDQIRARTPGAKIIATTNEAKSDLAMAADAVLLIHAGEEYTVSTRTYLNTLVCNRLAEYYLTDREVEIIIADLKDLLAGIESYVLEWQQHVSKWKDLLHLPKKFFVLGRGESMAAVMTAALTTKEAAKWQLEGLTTAHFRHGPLEQADEDLTVLILAGNQRTRELNQRLAQDVQKFGGKVIWLDHDMHEQFDTMTYPAAPEAWLPIVEMLPLQMLTIALAEQHGFVPGEFRYLGKVTRTE